jgi:hypothetical protein
VSSRPSSRASPDSRLLRTESAIGGGAYAGGDAYGCDADDPSPDPYDFNFITYRAIEGADTGVSLTLSTVQTQPEELFTVRMAIFNFGPNDVPTQGSVNLAYDERVLRIRKMEPSSGLFCFKSFVGVDCRVSGSTFPAGGVHDVTITFASAQGGSFEFVATTVQHASDPAPANNRASAALEVFPLADDIDGDGLLDPWEDGTGLDVNEDGVVDLDLAALGASPLRKDVFVELDAMVCTIATCGSDHVHDIPRPTMEPTVTAFANADVENPDPAMPRGVTLHLFDNGTVPAVERMWVQSDPSDGPTVIDTTVDSYDDVKRGVEADASGCDGHFGPVDLDDPNCAAKLEAWAMVFHYGIIGHDLADVPEGAQAEIGGADLVFSDIALTAKAQGFVTTEHMLERTFMHELGHNLGLLHAGDENLPFCKPNYMSVMNPIYTWHSYWDPNAPLDYSREKIDLDENSLNEGVRLGGTPGKTIAYAKPDGEPARAPADGFIDWDLNPSTSDDDVEADINRFVRYPPCAGSGLTELRGHDDWANLVFNHRASDPVWGGLVDTPLEPAIDELVALVQGPDGDGDGIPDARDVEHIQAAVTQLPDDSFFPASSAKGKRRAIVSNLDEIEALIGGGDVAGAITKLEGLRKRMDGCGLVADVNDWISHCARQASIRGLVDELLAVLT